jgi:Ca2+-binding RTX toxin-like protein
MVTIVGTRRGESLSGTNETDYLNGMGGNDFLYGHEGDDSLYGGSGDDYIQGGADNDHLFGEDGRDTLQGQTGDDVLDGGAGNDKLLGGPGTDYLTGGVGADTFVWARGHADANLLQLDRVVDTITDFESGIDKIDISHFDADETTPFTRTRKGEPGNDAFTYVTETDGITPGHLTLTYDPLTGYTTLNAYTDTEEGADFTLLIFGQVNPGTDIVF